MVFANNANIPLLISLTVLSNQVFSYYNMDTLHRTCPYHSAINMRKTYNLYTDSGLRTPLGPTHVTVLIYRGVPLNTGVVLYM